MKQIPQHLIVLTTSGAGRRLKDKISDSGRGARAGGVLAGEAPPIQLIVRATQYFSGKHFACRIIYRDGKFFFRINAA